MERRSIVTVLLAWLVVAAGAGTAWAGSETMPVALAGEPAPGAPGRTFRYLYPITINDAGAVMFGGLLDPSDASNDRGIWYGTPGALSLAVRKGDPAPGVPGRTFADFTVNDGVRSHQHLRRPRHNDAGQMVFIGYLDGPDPTVEAGIWVGTPGNFQLVALYGQEAPGRPGQTFRDFTNLQIDDSGNVLFQALTDGFELGLWYYGANGLIPVVVRGAPAPGRPGDTFRNPIAYDLSPTGDVMFEAQLEDLFTVVLYSGDPQAPELVLARGDPAPDAPGAIIRNPGSFQTIFPSGSLLFSVDLDPVPNDGGIYFGPPNDLRLVMRSNEPAPGTGTTFASFGGTPDGNAGGSVAFVASLDPDPNVRDDGLFTGPRGGLQLVARTGDPAPGSGGRTFGEGNNAPAFLGLDINDSGIVAFEGKIPSGLANGLWFWSTGTIEPVVVADIPFQVRPGDVRTPVRTTFVAAHDGFGTGGVTGLNARDEIAFRVTFPGGTNGLFVSRIDATTNEPPVCDDAQPSIADLWPPNHEVTVVSILGVVDPEGDPVEIHVDAVTSDEPASGPGTPQSPDAFLLPNGTVGLRAERLGGGNGRVYEIHFTASDGADSCTGTVRVNVRHDQSGAAAIDDGQNHDATQGS